MRSRYLADGTQGRFARIGEPERINATVLGIRLPDHKSSLFQRIDHRYKSAGVHIPLPCEVLLADARRMTEQSQDAGVRGSEIHRQQGFGEFLRRTSAHLSKEKC